MILQKDLQAEAAAKGINQYQFRRRVIDPLMRDDAITPKKNQARHNRVEYSDEDAEKIRKKLEEVIEENARLAAEEAESKHSEEPTSLPELATTPGPEKPKPPAPKPKKKATTPAEKKESGWKEKLMDKKTLLIIGGVALLLLGLWWFRRHRGIEEEPAPESPPNPMPPGTDIEQKWREVFG